MKIIPFRINATKEEDNFSDVYAFLIQGNQKDAYEVEIDIDSLNDVGITDTRCTCDDCKFKRIPNCKRFVSEDYKCKHINLTLSILSEFGIKTDSAEKPKVVILDDNELSMACYAEEYPENFKAITESETTNINKANNQKQKLSTAGSPKVGSIGDADIAGFNSPTSDTVQSTHSEDLE